MKSVDTSIPSVDCDIVYQQTKIPLDDIPAEASENPGEYSTLTSEYGLKNSMKNCTENKKGIRNCSIPSIQVTSADKVKPETLSCKKSPASSPSSSSLCKSPQNATVRSASLSLLRKVSSSFSIKRVSGSDPSSPTPSYTVSGDIDGGWGWMVVFSSFIAHVIADGCGFSFGILFSELLDVFGETKGVTAWVGSLFVSIPAICGPIASALTNRFGCRITTILGGFISAFGCLLSAHASSIGELCFTFGVISGFGLSLVFVPTTIIVAFYFERRRAFATGVAVAGSGIGTMIFAPLIELLIDQYQWRGTFYIIAGILLNIVVCGALFRPLETSHLHVLPIVTSPQRTPSFSSSGSTNQRSLLVKSANGLDLSASLPALYDSRKPQRHLGDGPSRRSSVEKRPPESSNQWRFPQSMSAGDSAINTCNSTILEEGEEQEKSSEKLLERVAAEDQQRERRNTLTRSVDFNNQQPSSSSRIEYKRNISQSFPEFELVASLDDKNKIHHSMSKLNDALTVYLKSSESQRLDKTSDAGNSEQQKVALPQVNDNGTCLSNEKEHLISATVSNVSNVSKKYDNNSNKVQSNVDQTALIKHTGESKKIHPGRYSSSRRPDQLLVERNVFHFPTGTRHLADRGPMLLSRGDMSHRGSLLTANFFLSIDPPCRSASCPEISIKEEVEERKWRGGMRFLQKIPRIARLAARNAARAYDLSVFRSPVFVLFCLHTILLYISYDIPYVYGPVRAMSLGISDSNASFLVSIIGLFSTIGQVLMGYLGDQSYISVLPFYNTMTTISGVATILMPCAMAYFWLGALCALYGFFISANFALTTVILIDLIGMERLTNAYGLVSLAQGVSNLLGPPLAGWLSDVTSSYNPAFYTAGTIVCASGLLLFMAPILSRCEKSRLKLPKPDEADIPA